MKNSDTPPALDSRVLRLAPNDNVGVAKETLASGESILIGNETVLLDERIATGHKLALAPIAAGEKVIKYGLTIGSATADIRPGRHVHTHNMKSDYLPTYERGEDVEPAT